MELGGLRCGGGDGGLVWLAWVGEVALAMETVRLCLSAEAGGEKEEGESDEMTRACAPHFPPPPLPPAPPGDRTGDVSETWSASSPSPASCSTVWVTVARLSAEWEMRPPSCSSSHGGWCRWREEEGEKGDSGSGVLATLASSNGGGVGVSDTPSAAVTWKAAVGSKEPEVPVIAEGLEGE